MTEIELLKKELQEKITELNACLEKQQLLKARLKHSSTALEEIRSQLKGVEAYVTHINEYIYQLQLENEKFRLSSDVWMNRAINLEFKVLGVRNGKD